MGGRRQLLRSLGVDVRSAISSGRIALGSAVPTRGTKVRVDAYTGEVSRRDMLGGLIHEDHAVTA